MVGRDDASTTPSEPPDRSASPQGGASPQLGAPRQAALSGAADTPLGQAMSADHSGLRMMIYLTSLYEITREDEVERMLKVVGLSVAKDRVLSWLSINPGASMTQLSRGVTIDRTTLTRLLDQMVKDGAVQRDRSPVDRREIALRLTERGVELLHVGIEVTDTVNARYRDVLSEGEVRAVGKAMLKLLNASSLDDATFQMLTGRRRQGRPATSSTRY